MFWLVMGRRWRENARFRFALFASLALHGLGALLLPSLTPATQPSPDTLETISYQRVVHVALQSKAAPSHAHAVVAPKSPAIVPRYVRSRVARPARKAVSSRPRPRASMPPSPGATLATREFSVGVPSASPLPAERAPVTVAKSPAPATAAPPAAAAAVQQRREIPNAAGAGARSGLGMLGELQDPALAKPVMDELLRRFKINVTLVVTVGDDGKTKQIEFHPPVASNVEDQIRTLLAQANWDPALCGGGIACEGKATIKLF